MIRLLVLLISLSVSTLTLGTSTHEYTLGNGLRIIVREDHRAPIFVSQLWYRVGSTYEPQGLTGISHIVEHMMFKGSQQLAPGEFSRTIANVGGEDNAFTSHDFTGYFQILTTPHLPLSFKLEADRMHNLAFDPAEYEKELKVIMEERRLRVEDNPNAQLAERFASVAHMNSYGQPVIGWMEDIEHITLTDVKEWYKKWYAPNNATLVVVGDVSPEEVFKKAKRFFGPIARTSYLPSTTSITQHADPGERRLTADLPAQVPGLLIGFNVPVLSTAKTAWEPYALLMLAAVLDGGNSARLNTTLIRQQEIATSVSANYDPYTRGDTLLTLNATPNLEKKITTHELEKKLWQQIELLKAQPPTQKELARIKAQVLSELTFSRDSIVEQATMIGSLESVGLSWRLIDQELDKLSSITPQQIQEVAHRYLTKQRSTTAILNPTGSVPTAKTSAFDTQGMIK